ncbi:unnamed protein product [Alopecurus aequalis]
MEKALALALLLISTLLITGVDGQAFCRSQISLANEACSLRNFPGARPPVPRQQQLNATSTSTTSTTTTTDGGKEYALRSRDADDDEEREEDEGGRHHRRQRHRHSADNSDRDPYDTACCRRLMAIDNACVCQAVARLPVFMTSVWHVIRLTPVDGCDVSFECPGSFSPLD